ncbi:hypothetical protein HK097_003394 [Rhizophlyctis rosea]|uniref:Cas12f1-like TNB domain-containing protein n=1 Tax=Rhizophlyctis rosea TaxID=64517 RepID=A0AAD5X690_9FUNG|nr:hypothetical protein HK097_003394 [Rhizophlyctis rosea]
MTSIDPGFRLPWTCYDAHRRLCYGVYPDLVGELSDIANNIALLHSRKDLAASRVGTGGSRCRPRYAKGRKKKKREAGKRRKKSRRRTKSITWQMQKLHDLQKAIIRQAHGAFANHLIRYYDVIVLPEFMTANMVRKRRKHLNLPPVLDVTQINATPKGASANPYEIKDVICTSEEYITEEYSTTEYTTKQCPFCDFVHHKIGSNKTFKCGECGFTGGRASVGSFNIGLRSLVKDEVRILS